MSDEGERQQSADQSPHSSARDSARSQRSPGAKGGQAIVDPHAPQSGSQVNLGVMINPQGMALDPLAEKMTPEHITLALQNGAKMLENTHMRKMWELRLITGFAAFVLLVIVGLCWLFLAYNKPELIEKIVAMLIGLLTGGFGGFGLGRLSAKKSE